MSKIRLKKVVSYSRERIGYSDLKIETYISTDNLLPNKQGLIQIDQLPTSTLNTPKYSKGNILVSNIRPYLKKIYYSKQDGGVSADVLTFVVKEGFDSKYVYYALFQDTFFAHMMAGSKGTKMPRGDKSQILQFEIPDFDFTTQEKIAAVLSALDDKIALNNCINTELEQMAKTLYDYWFVQFDFPDADGKPYKSCGGKMVFNEVLKREVPEGWGYELINDLGTIVGGSTPSKATEENFCQEGTPWITPKDLSMNVGNKFITKGELDVSNKGLKEASLNILPARSVLMSSRAPVGYLAINRIACTTNQGFKSIVCDKEYSCEYVFYILNQYMPVIEANATGSTFKEISAGVLKEIRIIKPEYGTVKKFVERVQPIFNKQDNLEQQNRQLSALRDWLLPMLMNGQVKIMDVVKKSNAAEEQPALAAEPLTIYGCPKLNIPESRKNFAKQVLAGKIISEFKDDPNLTEIKFQKIQFLAEHIIEADLKLNYYYQAAGPYDNVFMHTIYNDFRKQQWFDCQNKRFIPLEKQGKIEEYYQGYFAPAQEQLNKLFELLYQKTEAEAEIIATLYAVWNNRIIEKRSLTDQELIEDFYQWSDRKRQYSEAQVLEGLKWLRINEITPKGFGKLIKKAKGKK